MEQRISIVTLGVADLERARVFYQRLGWKAKRSKRPCSFRRAVSRWY